MDQGGEKNTYKGNAKAASPLCPARYSSSRRTSYLGTKIRVLNCKLKELTASSSVKLSAVLCGLSAEKDSNNFNWTFVAFRTSIISVLLWKVLATANNWSNTSRSNCQCFRFRDIMTNAMGVTSLYRSYPLYQPKAPVRTKMTNFYDQL